MRRQIDSSRTEKLRCTSPKTRLLAKENRQRVCYCSPRFGVLERRVFLNAKGNRVLAFVGQFRSHSLDNARKSAAIGRVILKRRPRRSVVVRLFENHELGSIRIEGNNGSIDLEFSPETHAHVHHLNERVFERCRLPERRKIAVDGEFAAMNVVSRFIASQAFYQRCLPVGRTVEIRWISARRRG